MDSVTQATLGAAIGQAILGKRIGTKAALLGGVIATIPDLDVVLRPFFTPLQNISIHRGFSHSIFFVSILAVLLVLFLSKIKWTSKISKKRLFIFSWLCLFTHLVLDAFTTYGTQLYLPFSDERISFDSVNIVDPAYTLPLLLGLILSLFWKDRHRSAKFNKIGLVLSSSYLLFTLVVKQQTISKMDEQLISDGIAYNELLTVPVKMGSINWYGVAKSDEELFIGKYSHWNKNKIEFERFPINDHLLNGLDPLLVDRMKWFSQGFYTVAELEGKTRIYNMQCDMQGIRNFGGQKVPTTFYFEIEIDASGNNILSSGMHAEENEP